ncbi:hypothetical protein RHS01_11079 [Rhizoctonia solani]|uniref:Uncharacterized protein n=1 Tax=Rhizoctonia solani TaxID=456999 RepID=A0A8H7I5P2_9AGAM|nr:hypothetical protein RHS01_11079 [Rhizoctonia solani]
MASHETPHDTYPPNLFDDGQLRDPNLKNFLSQPQLSSVQTTSQQTSLTSPTDTSSSNPSPTDTLDSVSSDTSVTSEPASPPSSLQDSNVAGSSVSIDDRGSSDSDTEMADARSNFDDISNLSQPLPNTHVQSQDSAPDDLLGNINSLFRLLDLVDEHGSGGIVEKVVIDQRSLHRVLNIIQPGSYDSVSKINFKALDRLSIKPTGVYGNRSEIINFLSRVQYLDENSISLLSKVGGSDDSTSTLRSGLYLVLDPNHKFIGSSKSAYIIYWPEDTTWEDQAASSSVRLSPSQAEAFVWDANAHNKDLPEDQRDNDDDSRLFSFEVSKSLEQEEDAVGSDGFKILVESKLLPKDKKTSRVRLVPGEQKMALLTVKYERAQTQEDHRDENINALNLRHMISSKEHPLQLGDLKPNDIEILSSNGLRESHRGIFEAHEQRLRDLNEDRTASQRVDNKFIEDQILGISQESKTRFETLFASYMIEFIRHALEFGYDIGHGPEATAELHSMYSGLGKLEDEIKKKYKLDQVHDQEYQLLKSQWLFVEEYFDSNPGLSKHDQREFVDDVLSGAIVRADYKSSVPNNQSAGNIIDEIQAFGRTVLKAINEFQILIFAHIHTTRDLRPALAELLRRIQARLGQNLETVEKKVVNDQLDKIVSGEQHRRSALASSSRDAIYKEEKEKSFKRLVDELKEATISNSPPISRIHTTHTDKCLVIVSESDRKRIFIEDNITLEHSIKTTHGKVTLHHNSLGGSKCKFALDQTTRLLAIVHGQKDDLRLSIYIFDELFTNLRSRGSPIPLRNWYNQPVDINKVCFVSGAEEVCLIEESGRVRIFSLVTQQFR